MVNGQVKSLHRRCFWTTSMSTPNGAGDGDKIRNVKTTVAGRGLIFIPNKQKLSTRQSVMKIPSFLFPSATHTLFAGVGGNVISIIGVVNVSLLLYYNRNALCYLAIRRFCFTAPCDDVRPDRARPLFIPGRNTISTIYNRSAVAATTAPPTSCDSLRPPTSE